MFDYCYYMYMTMVGEKFLVFTSLWSHKNSRGGGGGGCIFDDQTCES